MNAISRKLHHWNKMRCPNCGCRETKERTMYRSFEFGTEEEEILCANCEQVVNYWAYGFTEGPETYTELLQDRLSFYSPYSIWNSVKHPIRNMILYFQPCENCGKRMCRKDLSHWSASRKQWIAWCSDCAWESNPFRNKKPPF